MHLSSICDNVCGHGRMGAVGGRARRRAPRVVCHAASAAATAQYTPYEANTWTLEVGCHQLFIVVQRYALLYTVSGVIMLGTAVLVHRAEEPSYNARCLSVINRRQHYTDMATRG